MWRAETAADTTEAEEPVNWHEGFYSSQDGLRLHARHYPAGESDRRPLICLAGLTRNSKDFHSLATALCDHAQHQRDVYCLDYRGRGRSDHDANWKNYSTYIELIDVLDFMTITGLHDAAVLGTSRGGMLAMLMAVMRPTAIGVAILNDIGAVIDPRGIARIMGYVGQMPLPPDWREAERQVREMNEAFFTALSDAEWQAFTRQLYDERDGRPSPGYDPNLSNALSEIDLSQKIPTLWPQFAALGRIPTLLIRGENSDLLTEKTAEEMAARHPRLRRLTVDGQGHAPLLNDAATIEQIARFLAESDDAGKIH